MSSRRLNKFGVLRKKMTKLLVAKRPAIRELIFASVKNEVNSLNEKQHILRVNCDIDSLVSNIPTTLHFRKKDLGGRLTALEKKQ